MMAKGRDPRRSHIACIPDSVQSLRVVISLSARRQLTVRIKLIPLEVETRIEITRVK